MFLLSPQAAQAGPTGPTTGTTLTVSQLIAPVLGSAIFRILKYFFLNDSYIVVLLSTLNIISNHSLIHAVTCHAIAVLFSE